MKTTVLLVTHAVHRLSYSNHVIALDAMGRIVEQGSFDVLKDSGGYVQSLASKLKGEDDSSSEGDAEEAAPIKLVLTFHADQEEYSEVTEELNRQTGDFQVYKYYFASIGWKFNLTFVSFVVLYGTAGKLTEFVVTYCKLKSVQPRMLFIEFFYCFRKSCDEQTGTKCQDTNSPCRDRRRCQTRKPSQRLLSRDVWLTCWSRPDRTHGKCVDISTKGCTQICVRPS